MKIMFLFYSISAGLLSSCSPQSTLLSETTVDSITANNGIAGTYIGHIPCPDCSGIIYKLTLNADSTYQESMQYQGGSNPATINNKGKWRYKTTAVVELLEKTDGHTLFSSGENQLTMLDRNGQVISEPTKNLYILERE